MHIGGVVVAGAIRLCFANVLGPMGMGAGDVFGILIGVVGVHPNPLVCSVAMCLVMGCNLHSPTNPDGAHQESIKIVRH